ncbi:DUF5906 domain-containing protein [Xenorhabdus ehlersii]|uniref:DNA primase n=1 Tax=Xenorhabdus ehlersii TaxID=290111 RepID=A0A2D0IND3_9GAMM|nr:DUF5906 domain-containing protein [Xenorhabdus ehlersii]PHM23357.1 DNA primase [Xenorhabdus ehlersii]RKE93378.1 putative DNA primase/helicase [Xenorhabdus ehlersii]
MKAIDVIREVKLKANGQWQGILSNIGAELPLNQHTACPACGGRDRFRFDDKDGNGTFICNQCGAGDGLDLVQRVLKVSVTEAAQEVANIIGIDTRSDYQPSRNEAQIQAQQAQHKKKQANQQAEKQKRFTARYNHLLSQVQQGESAYLNNKGLSGFTMPLLADGSLLIPLVNTGGAVAGAQVIKPNGDKRHLTDSTKKGSYYPINTPEHVSEVIITEGLATALTCHLIRPDALTVAAMDAGNLEPVAVQLRNQYADVTIIIAADNDIKPDEWNTGKISAEKAAKAVKGSVTLPPTEYKADWDDYRQHHGIEAAKQAFSVGLYQYYVGAELDMYELGSGEVITGTELALLEKMNKTYTHITIGGKHRVVSLKPCQVNGVTHVFEELPQFKNYFLHEGRIAKKLSLGDAWLKWKGKNYKPNGVGFYPEPKKCPNSVYNLFMGLAVEPVEGDCSTYLNHIKQVICAGDERAYQYVLSWLAHLFQKPDEKPSVAIAMKSVPGTGKGTLVRPLLEILGQYGVQVNGAEQITNKFNSMMANKLLIFADEATVAKASDGEKLRGIISEPTLNLERKGIDAEPMVNFSRLIFASNSTQALKAGIRERRYLVLEPDGTKAQDKAYFDNLYQWLNDNGASKLLHYLLHYDITHFDRHRAPQTDALKEEILFGLTGLYAYLYAELSKDEPFRGMARIPVSELIDSYLLWCKENNEEETEPAARRRVGSTMVKMGLDSSGRRGRGIGIVYELPSVNELRVRFAQMIGMGVSDVF